MVYHDCNHLACCCTILCTRATRPSAAAVSPATPTRPKSFQCRNLRRSYSGHCRPYRKCPRTWNSGSAGGYTRIRGRQLADYFGTSTLGVCPGARVNGGSLPGPVFPLRQGSLPGGSRIQPSTLQVIQSVNGRGGCPRTSLEPKAQSRRLANLRNHAHATLEATTQVTPYRPEIL